MINYLISFVLCSGLLLLVYHVFLSQENLYRFNRFYLLLSLVFSMIVPAITIQVPQTMIDKDTPIIEHIPIILQQPSVQQITAQTVAEVSTATQLPSVSPVNYTSYLLWALYGLIVMILLIRFVLNLYNINQKINKSETQDLNNVILVLLADDITPHSFLNYIFINKNQYQNGSIEAEIICHEQAHVRQLHSVDVILIELLQIVCWFNPFIFFYRKVMQLNHEFLADEAVVQNCEDTPAYQLLLVAKAQQGSSLYLTSQFNYLTIKKRLIMMTKNTSAKVALYKKLALLPVLAVALLLFSHKVMAYTDPVSNIPVEKPVKATGEKRKDTVKRKYVRFPMPEGLRTKHATNDAPQSILDAYEMILKKYDLPDDGGGYRNISDEDKEELHTLFIQMSAKQQDTQLVYFSKPNKPAAKNTITAEQLTEWLDSKKYGVWVDGKRIKNVTLANYKPDDFDNMWVSRLTPIAVKNDRFHYQVELMTKPFYAEYYSRIMADQSDQLHHIHPNAKEWQEAIKNRNLRLQGAKK